MSHDPKKDDLAVYSNPMQDRLNEVWEDMQANQKGPIPQIVTQPFMTARTDKATGRFEIPVTNWNSKKPGEVA